MGTEGDGTQMKITHTSDPTPRGRSATRDPGHCGQEISVITRITDRTHGRADFGITGDDNRDSLAWLTAESALGRVREATLVRASLISGEPCKPEALTWLRELTTLKVLKALWAAQVLRTLHDRGLA
jgi:hypothetical protein